MNRSSRPFLLIAPAASLIGVFLILPYLNIVVMSFRAAAQSKPYGAGLSADNYIRFFSDSYYIGALAQTFWLGVLTTMVCLVLGFPVALQIARSSAVPDPGRLGSRAPAVGLGVNEPSCGRHA